MKILVVPMFALSRMNGPWSRAQIIAESFERAGHDVTLAWADDGNCVRPRVADTAQLPVPSPLGLPLVIASRTFPLAEKLGIAGRKPVRSFEEVLWLTGALDYGYERESVGAICEIIADRAIDAVYSEFSLPAIIAARACTVPVFGSFSYTTQVSYAHDSKKAGGVRKLVGELGLPAVQSALELFDWLDRRFVPSCYELEPIPDDRCEFIGFLGDPAGETEAHRDCILVYLGAGSVLQQTIEQVVVKGLRDFEGTVYVAGAPREKSEGNVQFAPRFDFSQLLLRARCFVHHGGQNSTMDAFAYRVPQVVVPGRVFERIYNAESVERVGAGLSLSTFDANALGAACHRVMEDESFEAAAKAIHRELAVCGGASRLVRVIEERMAND